MGSPRARRHPRLRLFGRQDLRSHFQRCDTSSRCPTVDCSFPSKSDRIIYTDDGQWGADVFEAHAIGCNAVSWAPAARAGSLLAVPSAGGPRSAPVKRFASAGCDNIVKIWGFSEETQAWVEEDVLEGHADWVRDVAWAPNIGLPRSYIATASQVRFLVSLFRSVWSMCGVTCSLTLVRAGWAGQDRVSVDKRYTDGVVGQDCTRPVRECGSRCRCHARQVPGRRVACLLEPRWERARRQLRRWEGHALEGEPERRMGMCE
jgi:hypothetical protein